MEKNLDIAMHKKKEDFNLLDLTSDNQDLKYKIAVILTKLETTGVTGLEDQIVVLMQNMMNFFAQYVEEIPNFNSLDQEQQKALLLKFKGVALGLAQRRIKSVDEMMQVFLFTILGSIGTTVEKEKDFNLTEITNKKHQKDFKEFLRRCLAYEFYKITNPNRLAGETREENFLSNAVLLGVKEALKYEGLEQDVSKISKSTVVMLEKAHHKFENLSKKRGRSL